MKYGYVQSYVTTNIELINNLIQFENRNVRFWLKADIIGTYKKGPLYPRKRTLNSRGQRVRF